MYDLEHFWVYVGHDGKVYDGEASAHGSYMNCYRYQMKVEEETHIPVYVQPGKHALLPDGNLFKLFSDYEVVCNHRCGIDGLLVAGMFQNDIMKSSYIDYQVNTYIREHYSFQPSLEFHPVQYAPEILITWEELFLAIPKRIHKLLDSLRIKI
jgi:hypothetical protein